MRCFLIFLRRHDGPTDIPSYRDARSHLKKVERRINDKIQAAITKWELGYSSRRKFFRFIDDDENVFVDFVDYSSMTLNTKNNA